MLSRKFCLSTEECEILILFEETQSLAEVAQVLGRDHSVVARALKKITDRFPVAEKRAGKWFLTELGRSLNETTRSALRAQQSALGSSAKLRIGTNREFSSRVLCWDFQTIQALFPNTELSISAYQQGTESALLMGQIDVGIDCERPHDPDISYRLMADEEIIVVASKDFIKRHQLERSNKDYSSLPHLFCERLSPDKMLSNLESATKVVARFNDIASARAACVGGIGWALLPRYAVQDELDRRLLIQIDKKVFGRSKYGVWWLRGRSYLKPTIEKLCSWLKGKKL